MDRVVDNTGQDQKFAKLALKLDITHDELDILCQKFANVKIDENLSPGQKALNLVHFIKHALNLKLEDNKIESKIEFPIHKDNPAPDSTKSKLVKGLFVTFMEHKRGLPGLISIVSGIGAAGFGYGKFSIDGLPEKINLADIKANQLPPAILSKAQADFFSTTLVSENLAQFPNIRLGVYSLITGCALIPTYAAALKKLNQEELDDVHLVQKAKEMIENRFSPKSETLSRFITQNLFRVIFEELFNYESTVFSIFE